MQRAKGVGRAGGVAHIDARLVGVGVDIGQAGINAGQRVAALLQLFQTTALGTAPGGLGELLARAERPGFLNLQTLRETQLLAGIDAGKADLGFSYQRGRARVDLDHDLAWLGSLRGVAQLHRHRGAEVTQRANQLAHIGVGGAQQARQLTALQIGLVAKAFEF